MSVLLHIQLEDHVSIPILTDDPELTRRNPPHQRHLSPEHDDRDTQSTETDITLDTTLDTTPNAPLQSSQDTTPCNFTPAQIPPPPPDLIPNQCTPGGGTAMPALIEDSTAMSDVSDPDRTPVSVVIVRTPSRTSIATTINLDVCRICHCESEPGAPLISPCICSGSLKWVHQACLQQWIKSADTKSCELCKFDFSMTTKIKPFRKVGDSNFYILFFLLYFDFFFLLYFYLIFLYFIFFTFILIFTYFLFILIFFDIFYICFYFYLLFSVIWNSKIKSCRKVCVALFCFLYKIWNKFRWSLMLYISGMSICDTGPSESQHLINSPKLCSQL